MAGVAAVWAVLVVLGGPGHEEPSQEAEGTSTSRAAAASTTSQLGSTTSTTAVIPGAPLLGEPSGWELVVVGATGQVIDLDTGGITRLRAQVVGATDHGILIRDGDGLVTWPPPYDGSHASIVRPSTPGTDIEQLWVVGDGSLVWTIERPEGQDGPASTAVASLLGLDGRVLGSFELPGEVWPLGAIEDRMVLAGPGGVYLIDPAGDVERVSTGNPLGVVGDRIYATNCDEELRCHVEVLDGGGRLVDQLPSQLGNFGWAAAAPDGRIAVVEYPDLFGEPNQVTIDGVTVYEDYFEITGLGGLGGMAWSPDGRWLALAVPDGLHFLDTVGGAAERVVDVGLLGQIGYVLFVAPDG